MPYIPHTELEVSTMLQEIGLNNLDELFAEIPKKLRCDQQHLQQVPAAFNEIELLQLFHAYLDSNKKLIFTGAGSYNHYIPGIINDLVYRGEFLTAYTPYQPEASQGNLQIMYEYQTMMAELMSMEVSNSSLYDGASALVEAALMAKRCAKHNASHTLLVPRNLHPHYQEVLNAILPQQNIELKIINFAADGKLDPQALAAAEVDGFFALIIQQPNFFGQLEDVHTLTNWAHKHHALVIACVNPIAMAVLSPPGVWGEGGADIACGEGQPLGIPMSGGGPYFGFMTTKMQYVRQLPGRIVGRTIDRYGKRGFVLTLQAREQHIRRSKATSNICTNQGLMVIAATIYMSLLGAQGMAHVAAKSHENLRYLAGKIRQSREFSLVFPQLGLYETVVRSKRDLASIVAYMEDHDILPGYSLEQCYPELANCLLVCTTELCTTADVDKYYHMLHTHL